MGSLYHHQSQPKMRKAEEAHKVDGLTSAHPQTQSPIHHPLPVICPEQKNWEDENWRRNTKLKKITQACASWFRNKKKKKEKERKQTCNQEVSPCIAAAHHQSPKQKPKGQELKEKKRQNPISSAGVVPRCTPRALAVCRPARSPINSKQAVAPALPARVDAVTDLLCPLPLHPQAAQPIPKMWCRRCN